MSTLIDTTLPGCFALDTQAVFGYNTLYVKYAITSPDGTLTNTFPNVYFVNNSCITDDKGTGCFSLQTTDLCNAAFLPVLKVLNSTQIRHSPYGTLANSLIIDLTTPGIVDNTTTELYIGLFYSPSGQFQAGPTTCMLQLVGVQTWPGPNPGILPDPLPIKPTIPCPICYHGTSTILTNHILTNKVELSLAKDILSSEHQVYSITQKKFVPVRLNIVSIGASKFIKIKKDLLGENKPDKDFFITPGHPIVIDGEEVVAEKIPGGERILLDSQEVYSISTDERESILVNNLPVITWSYYDWMNRTVNHNRKTLWYDNQNTNSEYRKFNVTLLEAPENDLKNVKIEKDAFGVNNPAETLYVHESQQVQVNDDIVPITVFMHDKWVKFL